MGGNATILPPTERDFKKIRKVFKSEPLKKTLISRYYKG
uniref:Uncharacterized protein n=1 Tax=Siphoviridae sp. ctqBH20 TaxID=2825680 RepID=A0A8S5QB42_9CAUD|nr:MAG TPA: hypothetical protein [Siphoviridae sp. ctqBH20]